MEGRWAQLTVAAHIAHAIDYSKPVSALAEEAIFAELEFQRRTERLKYYPVLDEDGKLLYATRESIQWMIDRLSYTPTTSTNSTDTGSVQSEMLQGIELLEKYKKLHGMSD